ncbi:MULTISPECIES: hypothetical protein [Halorussus]|uniref:EMC6-like membrane protein n=1 Tax=Halorussus TaxID=1070314 RepID=UPI000E21822A|nr:MULTISPECIES: hypothetical protein [Halorussus]NHN57540.1 hypothetical protein [Halorussus sp. JP-T4]
MATEQASERRASHVRGVTVTAVASLGGIAAALVSAMVLGTAAKDQLGLAIVVAFVVLEMPIMQGLGIDVGDFSTKDHLYVAFMTFSLWFVTWTILLTNGVTF